jgi:hypothetical protein
MFWRPFTVMTGESQLLSRSIGDDEETNMSGSYSLPLAAGVILSHG